MLSWLWITFLSYIWARVAISSELKSQGCELRQPGTEDTVDNLTGVSEYPDIRSRKFKMVRKDEINSRHHLRLIQAKIASCQFVFAHHSCAWRSAKARTQKECVVMNKCPDRSPRYVVIFTSIENLCCPKGLLSITRKDCDEPERRVRHHQSIKWLDDVLMAMWMILGNLYFSLSQLSQGSMRWSERVLSKSRGFSMWPQQTSCLSRKQIDSVFCLWSNGNFSL
jgi:hypothetical protein